MKSLSLLFTLGLRNSMRNRRRSLLTLFAICTGVVSSCLLASLARGLTEQMVDDSIDKLTGHIQIHQAEYLNDPVIDHRFEKLRMDSSEVFNDARILSWTSRVRVPAVISSERDSSGLTLVGTTFSGEEKLSFLGTAYVEGRLIGDQSEQGLVIGKRLAERLETKIGRRVVLMSQGLDGSVKDRGFRIIGLFRSELEATELGYAFTGRETLSRMLGVKDQVNEVSLRVEDRELIPHFVKKLSESFPDLKVTSWFELEPLVNALVKVQSGFLYIWYLIVIVTISFGLVNTQFMAIFERRREIAMLQALGMKRREVTLQIVLESLFLLSIGIVFGNVLTLLGVSLLSSGIDLSRFSEGTTMLGVRSVVVPVLKYPDMITVNIFALLLGVLSSLYPAWRAGKIAPAEVLAL